MQLSDAHSTCLPFACSERNGLACYALHATQSAWEIYECSHCVLTSPCKPGPLRVILGLVYSIFIVFCFLSATSAPARVSQRRPFNPALLSTPRRSSSSTPMQTFLDSPMSLMTVDFAWESEWVALKHGPQGLSHKCRQRSLGSDEQQFWSEG